MKCLNHWEIDQMLARLEAVSGRLSSGDMRRLKAIARTAVVIRQLPMAEWTLFERKISEYEAEPERKQEETENARKMERIRPEREESAALYVRELIRMQNDLQPGRRRRR